MTRSPGIAGALLVALVVGLAGAAEAAAPPGRTAALAFAQAVNLVAADLPGYTAKRHVGAGGRGSFGRIPACAALKRPTRQRVTRRDSPDFNHADQTVSSGVSVTASPAVAAQYLALVRGAGFRRCLALGLARSLQKHKRPKGITFRTVVTAPPVSAPGTDGPFAIHLSVRLMLYGLPVGVGGVYIHLLGFQLGPSLVVLIDEGSLTPFPAAEEQRLFALLVDRAIAHRL